MIKIYLDGYMPNPYVVFVELFGHHRASIALGSSALGKNRKRFGRSIEWELNGTRIEMHENNTMSHDPLCILL
jgi:hypothetical protein